MLRSSGTAEKVMFIVMAVFFALSLVDRHPVLMFYATLGLAGSGYLYASTKDRRTAGR